MTKTESANRTVQAVVIEACEQLLECQMAEGCRLAIPNTNNLIMVGPQEWIAKHVPGVEAGPTEVALGRGLIEIGQGHHGHERLPSILFGRNGAGSVGVETEGNRFMEPGECIVAITFENAASLDVVAEKLTELRARIWPDIAATTQASTAQADELKLLRNRVSQLEAARIGYASEFPLNADGEPDVGSVHANIRALKAKLTATSSTDAQAAAIEPEGGAA